MENFVHPENLAPRLCHLTKWPDFDGFGFNLQLGQYIGKVDDDSPAQLADLREGDRIIEVNGVNISNENHRQVVERIKAIQNETRLLVVDKETYEWYKERDVVIKSTQPNVIYCSTPVPRPELISKSICLKEQTIEKKDKLEHDEIIKKSEENNVDEVTNKLKSTKIQNDSSSERNNNNEKATNQNLVTKTPQKTHNFIVVNSEEQFENEKRLQEKKEQKKNNSLSPHNSISNSSQNIDFNSSNSLKNGLSSSNSSFSDNLDLNLNMSASEMRKLIASRKNLKTDVKKAQLDLRQKYQIIQQM